MKKFIEKYACVLAAFALAITTITANSTCICITHQEPLPKNAMNLRKF